MTSTELAVRSNGAVTTERDVVDGWITVAADVSKLSDYIAETDFVPKALRNKPAAIAACILTGRELGIGPMASLKSIHMVQGVPSLSAEYKRARALAAGHQIVIDESGPARCVVRGRRNGSDAWVTITWTMQMAERAKLTGKDVWKAYPQRMLQARATSELCDLVFPDSSLGLPTTEELEDGGAMAIGAAVVVSEAEAEGREEKPAPAPQANRRRRSAPVQAKPATTPPPAAPGPPADGLPPLPGEDEPDPFPAPGATQTTRQEPPAPAGDTDVPASGAASSEPSPEGDTVSDGKLASIWILFRQVFAFGSDDTDKARARAVCGHILNRELASTRDMTEPEAVTVADTLALWAELAAKQKVTPRSVLEAEMAAAEGGGDG